MKTDSAERSEGRNCVSGDDFDRTITSVERIIGYCERVISYRDRFGEKEMFLNDQAYQDACVMLLGQIGEEAKKIFVWLDSNANYPWKNVVRFRDFIYHSYSHMDYNMIWGIIDKDIPEVKDILVKLSGLFDDNDDN